MGQGPEELRRDIERRRDDLGATIDVIGDHISPGRIIERRRNRVVNGVRGVKDRVMGVVDTGTSRVGDSAGSLRDQVSADTIKQQTAGAPLVAGVIAFGVGFLVAAVMPATEPETQAAQRLQQQLEPATDALKESGQHVAAAVKDDAAAHASDVKDTATDAAGTLADTAKQQAQATKDDATQINRQP